MNLVDHPRMGPDLLQVIFLMEGFPAVASAWGADVSPQMLREIPQRLNPQLGLS